MSQPSELPSVFLAEVKALEVRGIAEHGAETVGGLWSCLLAVHRVLAVLLRRRHLRHVLEAGLPAR